MYINEIVKSSDITNPRIFQNILSDECLIRFNLTGTQGKLSLLAQKNWISGCRTAWGITEKDLEDALQRLCKACKNRNRK